jgi:hypothetical protein
MNSLFEYIAKHSGFSSDDLAKCRCFVSINQTPFGDCSDDTLTAFVRYISPTDNTQWGYDVFVLHETQQPSLVYWKISRVYSTHSDAFHKKELI